jgi:ribosomal protein S18 acetylase RimI-like enzyme
MTKGPDFHLRNISSRAATAEDDSFLRELFASTRPQEMAFFGDNEDQKRAFISMQFSILPRSYPDAMHTIILAGNVPIGRTIIDRSESELRLVDIALLPEFRNYGIGALLVRQLLDEGSEKHLPVRLQVFKYGDAVRFYERLGFQLIEENGSHLKMEWRNSPKNSDQPSVADQQFPT